VLLRDYIAHKQGYAKSRHTSGYHTTARRQPMRLYPPYIRAGMAVIKTLGDLYFFLKNSG
jgi:hypothetical protein